MKSSPLVSVLMTSYNREQYIAEAIESVLASTFTDFELIISDDNSSDATVSIVNKYAHIDKRIKLHKNDKNLGDYLNRNKAASLASGKYIKYADSDDIMYPHCLQVMVICMEKFPEAGLGLSAIGDLQRPYPVCLSSEEAYKEHFSGKGHFNRAPGSSIIKKTAFDKVGGFTGLRQVGDFECWLKIGCYFPLVKMPLDLYWSRLHGETESNIHSETQKTKLKLQVIKKIFAEEKVPLNDREKQKIIASFGNTIIQRTIRKLKKRSD